MAAVCGVAVATAGDPGAEPATISGQRLSLRQALARVDENPDVVRAVIDAELADADARALRRPWQLSVGVGGNRVDELGASLAPPRTAGRPFVEASVAHQFSTGTTVEAHARGYSENGDDSPWSSAQITLTQQLVRGLRPSIVDSDQIAAEHTARASAARARSTGADVRSAVAAAYWELAFAHADLAIRKLSVDAAREQARLTQALVREGQVPHSALLATEQAIASRVDALVSAEQAIVERSLALRVLIGLPIESGDVVVVPTDGPALDAGRPVDVAAALARALASSPGVTAAAATVDASVARRRAADDRVLPGLDLSIVADSIENEPNVAPADPTAPLTGESVTATLTLRYDLFGGQGAQRDRERAAERRARIELAEARRRIQHDVVAAAARVDAGARRIALTAGSEERAAALLKAEVLRFSGGQATVFDVLARQAELEEARRASLRAAIDRAIADADLHRLVGDDATAPLASAVLRAGPRR